MNKGKRQNFKTSVYKSSISIYDKLYHIMIKGHDCTSHRGHLGISSLVNPNCPFHVHILANNPSSPFSKHHLSCIVPSTLIHCIYLPLPTDSFSREIAFYQIPLTLSHFITLIQTTQLYAATSMQELKTSLETMDQMPMVI
ncbi:hypothetical protein BDA99DRAFT_583828 [Phascolomyces articulosus]|uniref:Uncharacterized protein n=1 Tax=Phascolomyces articulosus TaxID=60185 RepID=A0AAD5PCS5_9FUNG|nr:hypothetical protein BDA99DRAFT_583828 [Phascolomyces articulosus]